MSLLKVWVVLNGDHVIAVYMTRSQAYEHMFAANACLRIPTFRVECAPVVMPVHTKEPPKPVNTARKL